MSVHVQLSQEARALPKAERARILAAITEVEMHGYLAELFRKLNSDYWVEVTHGATEFGKDIVIVRNDPLSPDVIGVVVKRGDIRARTAGDVDGLKESVQEILTAKGDRITADILSQIAQAKNHPAELGAHIERLRVNKVIVVLVGEMSNNVRTRFEKEVGASGQVLDLAWLVDTFTEHYPQVFFDGRAVDFLDVQIQQLERDAFYSKAGKTLSECFVEPIVAQVDSGVHLDDVNLALQIRNRRIRFTTLVADSPYPRSILLVGDPGSGKSKAAAKLCINKYRSLLAQLLKVGAAGQSNGVPIMVPARKFQEVSSLEEFLLAVLPLEVRERFHVDMLVVDGLDEVVAAKRDDVLQKARGYANTLHASLLVTSRKVAALSAPSPHLERYELLPFEFSQAMKLMQNVLANLDVLPALRDGLKRIQAQIPMNPLSLLLLVELVAERKEVPSSITELYDRFLDLVFGRWDQEKGVEVLFEYVIKKRFLAALAFSEFHEKNRLEVPAEEFERYLTAYASEYGWDQMKLREFLKEVERAGILEFHEEVFFRHRSFLDYFVALHVYEQRTAFEDLNGLVARLYFDPLWSEVAFFFAGLGRELSPELLDRVLGYGEGEAEHQIDKLLVGRLLQAGWHSTAKVKESGLRRALDHVPTAAAVLRDLLSQIDAEAPLLLGDLIVLVLAEGSFGSMFLSQEGAQYLGELEDAGETTPSALLRRVALLWASRRYLDQDSHKASVEKYIATVESAQLEPLVEARLLILGAAGDSSNTALLKGVSRRLRRLSKRAPGALKPLFLKGKKGFRPAGARSGSRGK